MARSDGQFPKYTRIDIDAETIPTGYWTSGARKCMRCEKLWPIHDGFKQAPCCNTETNKCRRVPDLKNPGAMRDAVPDMAWRQAVYELNYFRFEVVYTIWNEGISDEELYLLATEPVDEALVAAEVSRLDELLA